MTLNGHGDVALLAHEFLKTLHRIPVPLLIVCMDGTGGGPAENNQGYSQGFAQ
jgi:hypothetical protein